MASILTAADRELVATLDKDDAKRMDLKSPDRIFYKTNEIFHAASAAVGSLNPYVSAVSMSGDSTTTVAVTFVDAEGNAAVRANATYEVIASIEKVGGSPACKFAFAASKTTAGFTMTIDQAAGAGASIRIPFIVVG